ncbi:MAG: succinate dehydrogenase, hydrophobic membrane anchor protein [Proteobacteria bacterium]|nr:succinate dehydrogenase, hydrophobic membrane anchor protein [Pseudomonadota bacterium]MDA1355472.1 succinate dehydrogenase, hydrophobic membrane anchor protein [Pseudomonadota bacterium]
MSIQTPLARVRHLGSAKEGVEHWWWQRLTAILLVPLSLWFVASIWWLVVGGATYEAFQDWLSGPVAAILMLIFVGALFYHLKLGLQTVIEDYVHKKAVKWTFMIMINLGCIIGAVAALYSTVAVAFGS